MAADGQLSLSGRQLRDLTAGKSRDVSGRFGTSRELLRIMAPSRGACPFLSTAWKSILTFGVPSHQSIWNLTGGPFAFHNPPIRFHVN